MTKIKQHHQLIRFGISGVAGFLVDSGIVALCTQTVGMGPIPSQSVAFSVAVTVTWLINRYWTFAEHASDRWVQEWLRYIAANSLGAAVNNVVFAALILTTILFRRNPVLAVAIGSLSGMGFNFLSSKNLIFIKRHKA
ncbi:MAG: GtrA family protein [Thermoplasmata archaeon]